MRKNIFCTFLIFSLFFVSLSAKRISKEEANYMRKKAQHLILSKKYKEALKIYLFCYDNEDKFYKGFNCIRRSFICGEIMRLYKIHHYKPVKEAMISRLNKILSKIKLNLSVSKDEFMIANSLIKDYDQQERFLRYYENLDLSSNKHKREIVGAFFRLLADSGKYKDIYNNIDLYASIEKKRKYILASKKEPTYYYLLDKTADDCLRLKKIFKANNDNKGVLLAEKLRKECLKELEEEE